MKLLIVGSRNIEKFNLSEYISPQTDLIISGGAKGLDSLAEKYADEHKLSKLIIRPRYDLYGKAAPLKRNEKMVDIADEILIVWDGISKGTKYTLEYAKKKNKAVKVILYSQEDKKTDRF